MKIAFSQRHIYFQEHQNMALFLNKINRRFFKWNYEVTSLIFIMKPQAS